jgi:imidazolonepropionase
MSILITNIKKLVQVRDDSVRKLSGAEMKTLPCIENAFLFIKGETISAFGKMSDMKNLNAQTEIDATANLFFHAGAIHIHTWFMPARASKNLSTELMV